MAHDGAAGIEKALLYDYDVVVLDRDLPKVHGDAVCSALVDSERQHPHPHADGSHHDR